MQRQSLGSPSRERLVISTDDVVLMSDDQRRRDSSPSSFSSSSSAIAVTDDGEFKTEKPHRSHSPPPENFIHFIPILIVFCFLVLYLSSHDPSPQDLAQFHGFKFKHPEEITELKEIDEANNNNKQLKRSKAFAIRSLTNLQEETMQIDSSNARSHRKLGDF
ncbi:uncharacterized protein LOC141593779 [Silene latifolia]|uniref:uncharacterized protein LOC141593779 n=1 Tax=Silene latifolia TaxID=37657 RepID=UPI003D772F67